jgi:hypothetical protein
MIWKKYEVVFTDRGALRGETPLRGEAEKPQALKRGGDFSYALI